jgi:rhodanese-related sulfurtransferase
MAFVVVAGLLVVGFNTAAAAQQSDSERIAISELKEKLDSGETFLLIDVREDSELEEDGAIKGAIHIPVGELDARMKDIPKDVELVFY